MKTVVLCFMPLFHNHPFTARRSNYLLMLTYTQPCMPASLTMLFTTKCKSKCGRVGSERLLLGASIELHVRLSAGPRHSNPMNGQLFMRRERRKGRQVGGNALPQWTSVILTSLLLYWDVLHEEAAPGPQTAFCSLCMGRSAAQSLRVTTLMCYFTAGALRRLSRQRGEEWNAPPAPYPGHVSL